MKRKTAAEITASREALGEVVFRTSNTFKLRAIEAIGKSDRAVLADEERERVLEAVAYLVEWLETED